jgi:hypothetical protein
MVSPANDKSTMLSGSTVKPINTFVTSTGFRYTLDFDQKIRVRQRRAGSLAAREGQLPAAHPVKVSRRGRVHGVDDRE